MSRKTRKLMWSAPLVAVLAIAGALTMFMTAAPNGAQAQASELPGVPQNVLAVLEDWRMVKLTWDAPTGGATPTGYRVDHSTDGNRWTLLEPNLTNTEYLHNIGDHHHMRTTSNYYRVFALNGGITGPVSSDYLLDTQRATCPSPVRNLAARALGQTSVRVTWTAPVNDGGTAITGYQIFVNNVDGTRMATVPADSGSYTDSNLTAETRYSYQVKPVTKVSSPVVSSCAESVGATVQTTTGVQTPPSPPQHLLLAQRCVTCTNDTDTDDKRGFYLYWHQPADLGGDSALGSDSHNVQPYHVEAEVSISKSERGIIKRNMADDMAGDLAYNKNNAGAAFAADFQYQIVYDDSGEGSGYEHSGIPMDGDNDRLTQIVFRVYAQTVTSDGKKLMSAPATIRHTVLSKEATNPNLATNPNSSKDKPRTHTPPKGTVSAKRDAHGNVTVTWEEPGSGGNIPISQYYIAVSTDQINWTQLNLGTRKTDPEYFHEASDAPKTGAIYYRVAAQNAQFLGVAKKSDGMVAMATGIDPKKPGCVTNLRAVAGENQVELTWGPPTDMGSHKLMGYNIYRRAGGTAVVGEANKLNDEKVSPDATSYTDEPINMPGETLYYKVVADNGVTEGDSCTTVEQFVVMPQETLNAPQGLTAEDAKDSSSSSPQDRGVLLLWTQEQKTAASAVIGYRVDRRINDGRWVTLTSRSNNDHTDWTDPDEPAAGEQRHYRVAAVSKKSTLGPWAIIDYPQQQDQPQDLGAPTNVMAMVDDSDPGSTSVTVTWTNGVNADRHIAVLFDANWEFHSSHIGTAQTDGMVTFENVQPGAYTAVVLSIEDNNQGNAVNFEYDIASVTVGAGN